MAPLGLKIAFLFLITSFFSRLDALRNHHQNFVRIEHSFIVHESNFAIGICLNKLDQEEIKQPDILVQNLIKNATKSLFYKSNYLHDFSQLNFKELNRSITECMLQSTFIK